MKQKKPALFMLGVFAVSLAVLALGHLAFRGALNLTSSGDMYRAKVERIIEVTEYEVDYASEPVVNQIVVFTARLRGGARGGDVVTATQYVDNLYPNNPAAVEIGDSIVLSTYYQTEGAATYDWMFAQYDRTGGLLALVGLFFGAVLLLGRKKGVATILALALCCGAIFGVYLPGLLKGANIYALTVAVTLFSIVSSLLLIGGFGKKTLCAIVGNAGGVLLAGALAALFSAVLGVTGMLDENYMYLTLLFEDRVIDLRAVIWSGIVIGALGAVMDVAMTIASAMNELSETMRDKSFKTLLRSGLNIGRDAIGTMANTLILAYIGSSLATILLLIAYNNSALYLLNLEMIVVEILQAMAGSLGILFAVPATALFAAWLFTRPQKSPKEKEPGPKTAALKTEAAK